MKATIFEFLGVTTEVNLTQNTAENGLKHNNL